MLPLVPIVAGLASGVAGGLVTNKLNSNIKDYNPVIPKPSYNPTIPNAPAMKTTQYNAYNPILPQNSYDQGSDLAGQMEAAKMGQYSMSSPSGNVSWSDNADGSRSLDVALSAFDQSKRDAAQNMLPVLANNYGDASAKRAENSVYNTFESRMAPRFEQEQQKLHTKLISQGLPVGSDAYNNAMQNLTQGQADARQNALNQSVLTGQQAQTNSLNNALSLFGTMSNVANPMNNYIPGLGGNFTSTYQNKIANKHAYDQMGLQGELAKMGNQRDYHNMSLQDTLSQRNTRQAYDQMKSQGELAKMNNQLSYDQMAVQGEFEKMKNARERAAANRQTNAGVGGAIAGLGSLFSDMRIKENIIPVGQLNNGLTVYRFNFKGEGQSPGGQSPVTRIGLIAQEVQQLIPEAVSQDAEGLLLLDYDLATRSAVELEGGSNNGSTNE